MSIDERDLRDLEKRVQALETSTAVGSERHKIIVSRLDKLDSHLTWLIRLVIAAIIGGFLTFVLKGGLAGVV